MSIRKQGEIAKKTTPAQTPAPAIAPFVHLVEGEDMSGPNGNPYVNWAIRASEGHGGLLVGSVPREKILDDAVAAGARVFVCLLTHRELERTGGPYLHKAQRAVSQVDPKLAATLEFIHVPIYDQQVAEDKVADELSWKIVALLRDGKTVYLHCMGGHGRSGTIASLVIAKACGISGLEALEACRKFHAQRGQCLESPGVFDSPETHEQRDQVFRLIDKKKAK